MMDEDASAPPAAAGRVRYRWMRKDDIPQVQAIDQLSFSLPWPANAFHYELEHNQLSLVWVAEIEDRPPGSEASQGEAGPAEGWRVAGVLVVWLIIDEAHIATIAVHPDYRKRGIARKLLQIGLQEALKREMLCATLEVRASNTAAQKLYQDFGFEIVGVRPHYYRDNNEDALIMTAQADKIKLPKERM
jgi:ribosomal-protein-alanine N-acetyltransferase